VIEFSVIQRPPNAPAFTTNTPVWQTCVRQVALVEEAAVIPANADAWHGEAAYAHLLEVVCGLHSPIVGETEVLHQFKVFTESLSGAHAQWREVCAQLLADARAVRATHLIGLGSRSYGSAVRRHVQAANRVAILGTGVLAQKIVPFVVRDGRAIDLWGRRSECAITASGLTYRPLSAPYIGIDEATAIVVAAPASAEAIAALSSRYRERLLLIDLRAEGAADPPPPVAPIVTLADIFSEFEAAARENAGRVAAAKADIARRARAVATRVKLNPSGWHDLCA
jgi:glutamyl-tRNA reductase